MYMQSWAKNRENHSKTEDFLLKATNYVIDIKENTLQKPVISRMLSLETIKGKAISLMHA